MHLLTQDLRLGWTKCLRLPGSRWAMRAARGVRAGRRATVAALPFDRTRVAVCFLAIVGCGDSVHFVVRGHAVVAAATLWLAEGRGAAVSRVRGVLGVGRDAGG